jgi:hypothetical protein
MASITVFRLLQQRLTVGRRSAEDSWTEQENARRLAEAEGILPPPYRMCLQPPGDALIV